MKMKKLLAGVLAGAMAVSAVTFTSITLSAADDPNEVVLYQYEAGVMTNYSLTAEQNNLLKNATASISVTVDGEGDTAYFYLQEKKSWGCTEGSKPTVTINSDNDLFDKAKEGGLAVNALDTYTKINKITLSVDGGAETTLYDILTAPAGAVYNTNNHLKYRQNTEDVL